MRIELVTDRTPEKIAQLTELWERSVKASHHFLSEREIAKIKGYVPQALAGVETLILGVGENGEPLGFMGIEEQRLEMLFFLPEAWGKGLGKEMLRYGMERYGIRELTVNEQNPNAKAFYEHMGFAVYKRSALDEQGDPYPLLYMKR